MCAYLLFILNWFEQRFLAHNDLLQFIIQQVIIKKKGEDENESSEGTYAFWMYKGNKVIKLSHYHYILC